MTKNQDDQQTEAVRVREANLITELRSVVRGRVITADDSGYDAARTVFYGGVDRRPAAIVRALDANDVVQVIRAARLSGLELAVRSGGHSSVGHSVSEGGLVLDLKEMRALDIDSEQRTAWVEAGLTAGEFTAAADANNLALGFGDTGSVGIGGITLGGGVGYLSRKFGLTIDNLLAAEIVTAEGQLLHTDSTSHPDLFWAIRGGGGNFGVVTRFKFQLHEIGPMVGGMLILPATPEVVSGFIREALAGPDELSTIANIMPSPPMPFIPAEYHGRLIVMALIAFLGSVEDGERVLAPFRSLAEPLADMLRPIRYPEMFPPEDHEYHPTAVSRTFFVENVDRKMAETIVNTLNTSDAVMRVTQLRVLGGAIARVPADATAYAHRQSKIMVNLAAFYNGSEDRAVREDWVAEFESNLRPEASGAYVNFLDDASEARVRTAYPNDTWKRLAAIKRRYDPTNLFRLNYNIPPAA